jgi:alkylated DNA repair dioxygenase AlkB
MIDGLTYQSDLLTEAEQQLVLATVDQMPWNDLLKRRVQHYGYRYDYKERSVDYSMHLGELPAFAKAVSKKLLDANLIKEVPDQVIVNEYVPGQGISAHVDCEPCFKDTIVTVSLGWAYEMEFIRQKQVIKMMLEKGSALVISGVARYQWMHQIRARKKDNGVERQRRISLTFRNVILND